CCPTRPLEADHRRDLHGAGTCSARGARERLGYVHGCRSHALRWPGEYRRHTKLCRTPGLYADEPRCAPDAAGESADPRAAYPRYRPRRTVTGAPLDTLEPPSPASPIAENVARPLGNTPPTPAPSPPARAPPSVRP